MSKGGYPENWSLAPLTRTVEETWLATGVEPPHWRVYDNGEDITDQPVETWPKYWQGYYARGWRPHSGPNADPPTEPGNRPPSMGDQVRELRAERGW